METKRPKTLEEIMNTNVPYRAEHCVSLLNKKIDGDILELGVCKGATTFPLAEWCIKNKVSKNIYACDTFEGLPYDDKECSIGNHLRKGECTGLTLEAFQKEITVRGYNNIIIPVPGLFEDTLNSLKDIRLSFVWLDADLYKPTLEGYKFVEDRVNKGGVIGFHDYDYHKCPGVKEVVDKVLDKQKFVEILHKQNCIFFKKVI